MITARCARRVNFSVQDWKLFYSAAGGRVSTNSSELRLNASSIVRQVYGRVLRYTVSILLSHTLAVVGLSSNLIGM